MSWQAGRELQAPQDVQGEMKQRVRHRKSDRSALRLMDTPLGHFMCVVHLQEQLVSDDVWGVL